MVKIYKRRILAEIMTVADVPSLWYVSVKKIFDDMYANGEITEEQYNKYMGIETENTEEE